MIFSLLHVIIAHHQQNPFDYSFTKVDKRGDWRVVVSLWIRHTAYEDFMCQDSFLFNGGGLLLTNGLENSCERR